MAKSVKQQMYEQLANQHVQQALNNIGMQQFQEAYNQWNADQAGLADFQAAYNAWSDANPVQPVEKPKAQSIPVLNAPDMTDFFKPKTASGIDVNQQAAKDIDRRAFNEAYARQQQEEQMLAGKRQPKIEDNPVSTTVNVDDVIREYALAKGISEDQARAELDKAEAMKNQAITAPGAIDQVATDKARVDLQTSKYLDPNKKLYDQEKEDARALAQAELAKFEYDSNKKPILRTEEDRRHYADMVNLLNKTNPVSNALTGAIQQPLNLARTVRDAGRSIGNQLTGLAAALGDKFGVTENATQKHNEKVAANDAFYNQNDTSMDLATQNALTQNPIATKAGNFAGSASMYALTNPLFDAIGAGAGLGKVGKFALNQVGQNLQDVALDTIPTLNRYMKDGELSDQEKSDLFWNGVWNGAGNMAMGGLGLYLQNKALKNVDDIDNVVRNATDQAETARKEIERLAKQMPPMEKNIPSPEEILELEREANTMDEIEDLSNIFKQTESPKVEAPKAEIPKAEEPKYNYNGGIDNPELTFEQNEKINSAIEYLEGPFNDADITHAVGTEYDKIVSEAGNKLYWDYENALESAYKADTPEAAQAFKDKAKELRSSLKSIDKSEQSSIKQLMDYWDTYYAVQDYKKALNGADGDAVVAAKKAVDAARNRLARGQGKNSTLQKAFSSNYGKVAGNAAEYYGSAPTDNMDIIQDWIDYDMNKPNRFATDANPNSDLNKVMAERVTYKPEPETAKLEGEWKVEDTPENAPIETSDDLWDELSGENPKTTPAETPVRTQEVNEQGQKLSRLHSTLQNTDKLTDAEKQVYADKNGFWYDPEVERKLADEAKADIEANGLDSIFDRYAQANADPSLFTGADAHKMHTASFDYSRLASEAKANGDNALADFYNAKARALELKAREIGTAGGQFNAATAYYARTPQGVVDTAYKLLDDQITDFKSGNPKLADGIDDLADFISKQLKDVDVDGIMTGTDDAAKDNLRKQILDGISDYLDKSKNKQLKNALGGLTDSDIDQLVADKYAKDIAKTLDMFSMGSFGVKQETIDQVMDIFAEAEKYGINSKQYYKLEKQAYALLANDLMDGKSFGDKFNAWRYFAMLSNPLTHVRNNLGNLTNGGLTGIKNNLAAAIEEGADRVAKMKGADGIQGGRTKAFLNWGTDKSLIEGAAKDFDDNAYRLYKQGGSKWINVGDDINAAAHTWKNKGAGKALNTMTEGNSKALDVEDVIAGKAKYQTSLAGFLKANGADASIFSATDDASKQLLDKARTYALNQANEATFHQNSALAKYFTEHFNGKLGNIVIPFKKTPANILQASFEYSPAGFINVAKKTNAWKKGAITTAEYIDDIAKATVGTTGLGIGALLAHEGILSISTGNETVDKFNTKRGQQNLALKVGNHYVNIGDLAPAAMPLVVGAAVYDTVKNTKSGGADAALDSILTGLGTISNTVTDMTMLSGLADILSSVRYSESDSDVWLSLGEQTAGNLASQMLPTVGGKIEKTIDDTKRTTYTDKTGKLAKYVDQERRYLQTKLPGLQEVGEKMEQSEIPTLQKAGDVLTLEPQIDGWGNEMKVQDYGIGGAGRVVNNFLNPLTTTTDTSDRLDDELRQLYDASEKNEDVLKFGTTSTGESKVDGQKMTDKQWTQYQKDHGSMKHDLGMSLIDSEYYKNADNLPQDKAEVVKSLGDFSKAYNQNKIMGKNMSSTNKNLAEIYDTAGGGEKGAKAVVEELTIKKKSSESGYASNTNAAKEIQKDLASGNTEAAQKKIDAAQELPTLGLDAPGPAYTYYNAQKQIPNLTVEEFANTYKSIDADGSQGIKQGEILDYLNKNKITSENEAKKLWAAYGSSSWAYIPKLKNGIWTKKKK